MARKAKVTITPATDPFDFKEEFCQSSSCPGFIVNWRQDWVSKLLRPVWSIEPNMNTTTQVDVCEVCEDALLGSGGFARTLEEATAESVDRYS